ncbi:MAG: PIN domain-containing protein [Candidatus Lokiarchaeota archaeon]|nr:PIN domain-containing protein [Candidatus Lokiarchaeota archaeon]MBD3202619.1 PIN domain-containing protein [Candidatus Lokiarchaeota archaeon]
MEEVGINQASMIEMIILDSTACIDYLKGNKELKNLLDNSIDILGITSISVYEIFIGLERTKRKISEARYNYLTKNWNKLVSNIQILSLGIKEAIKSSEIYDDLSSKGKIIEDNDILIAGIMLSNGINKIVTKNKRHFNRIKPLEIISY